MARTVEAGSATDFGTGRASRTSRCRHFARQPWPAVEICAEGVIWTNSAMGSCFCTAAPNVQMQHTPKALSRKRDIGLS